MTPGSRREIVTLRTSSLARPGGTPVASGEHSTSRVQRDQAADGAGRSQLWLMSALVVFEAVEASHVPLRLSHRPERSREFVRTLLSW